MRIIKTKNGGYWNVSENNLIGDPVFACPVGGGFQVRIPRKDVVDWNAKLPAVYHHITVGFDDTPVCKAYVNYEDRWNGWLKPLVDREGLDQFVKFQRENDNVLLLDADTLVITDPNFPEEEPQVINPTTIKYEGQPVTVWDLGGLGLTWEQVDES